MLGQPVHLQARAEGAQLVGDGQVAAGVAQADRRGHEEHPFRPVQRPGPDAPGGPGRAEPPGELPDRPVDDHRLARLRHVPRPFQDQQVTAGERGDPFAEFPWQAAVFVPVDGQHGAAHPAQQRLGVRPARRRQRPLVVHQHRLRADLHRPADAILALLGRMRLGQQLAEEELGVAAPVTQPVVPVVLRPALVGFQHVVEPELGASGQRRGEEGRQGGHGHDAEHPPGVQGRGQQRPPAAGAEPDQDRLADARRVHDRDGVGHEFGVGVGGRRLGPPGPPVPAGVDGDHFRRPGQVRHLGLPQPGVHECVRGAEDHGRLAGAEHLVTDLDAVPFHESLDVGISRPHDRLRPAPGRLGCRAPMSPFYRRPLQPGCNASATPGGA